MTRRSERPPAGGAAEHRRAGGRWRLRNWRLRTKLIVVLVVPTLAVVALLGLRAMADLQRANRFAEAAERVRVDSTVADLVHELQRERDLTVGYVAAGRTGDIGDVSRQRERVDAAAGVFERTLVASGPSISARATASFERMRDRLDVLTGLRYAGQHSEQGSDAVAHSYGELISGLLDEGDQAAADVVDDTLVRTRLAAGALARVKEQLSVRRALVAEAIERGRVPQDTERALLEAATLLQASREEFLKYATAGQRADYADTVLGPEVDAANDMADSVLASARTAARLTELSASAWDEAATTTVDLVKRVQEHLLIGIQQRSDALAAQARRSAVQDSGIVLGVLLAAGLLTVVIARSLLRPLRILRSSALEVAQYRLPEAVQDILADPNPRPEITYSRRIEAVPVFTREELGQVARAFDAVHGQAVRLAGEQALLRENVNSMFVNLSRRSQDLVERQLSVLDRMEQHEQDPDILGGLFELDHLATRMRRNSENLLVLAGQDAGRPLPESVSADEVIGAALSEVEHYQRIQVGTPPSVAVHGEAVSDVVHVISELLENATEYSSPRAPVSVVSTVTAHGEWRIDITDRGPGMPEVEIRRANARLAEPPAVDVEVSRRMGLYVVARLAERHRIRVWLATADGGGITASVVVPSTLVEFMSPLPPGVVDPAPIAPIQQPHPSRAARSQALPVPPPRPVPQPQPQPQPEPQPQPQPQPQPESLPPPQPESQPQPEPAQASWSPGERYGDHLRPEPAPAGRHAYRPDGVPDPADADTLPTWPVDDGDQPGEYRHPLEEDTPTDRMPAYQAALSEWFRTGPGSNSTAARSAEGQRHTRVSRAPEDVRARMTRLQTGVRRGREHCAD
ncbi:HAMP domain-containing protein,histidine kinase [Saccharomonospora marina XMU15]|uniref:histidine kinase n=1 Tax=Saccharomonospora marina XMU15 TaxID=882083 RepID=H5WZ35_9PSEU|nr:nitrate- and nitrite sensing domain-containing protein [Saccharomonospora marina]EHR52969.1 HAMP domain-containing protein,histidine kinase [Saccharomonospora marina XMU15]